MFANIVDAKDHSNQHQSFMVASLARDIAELCHLSIREQDEIELAALFQNLGKLRIPDAILEKNTSLSDDEQIKIRRQGFDTQIILRQIKGFDYIAKIISFYYKAISTQKGLSSQTKETIVTPIEASILMIANTFQTRLHDSAQNTLTPTEIDAILNKITDKSQQFEVHMLEDIASYLKSCSKKEA
jgi:response regulator RpfG family c-di-GMP phosphodiesterase